MVDIETRFEKISRSWSSYGLSLMLSVLIFFAIGSTHLGITGIVGSDDAELLFYFPPPPPPEEPQSPQPLPSQAEATFMFDFPLEKEESDEVQLEPLTVTYNAAPDLEADFLVRLDRGLKPAKPNIANRLVVYERDEVDQKPVRTYAPNLPLPSKIRDNGANLVVLYRVNNEGRTHDIHILDTDNPLALDVARKILEQSRFRPAMKDGVAVNVWVQHEMIFRDRSNDDPFSITL